MWWKCLLAALLSKLALVSSADSQLYSRNKHIQVFDKNSAFEKDVLRSDNIWMVQFCNAQEEICTKLVQEYSTVAAIMRGIVKLGFVDMETPGGLRIAARYLIDSYPTILMFEDDKNTPIPYDRTRDAQNMVQALMETMQTTLQTRASGGEGPKYTRTSSSNDKYEGKPSQVLQLNHFNFQQHILDNPKVSMVAFTAPWCGHCKRMMPEWEQAAHALADEPALLGVMDCTENKDFCDDYQVRSYPTLKLFPGGANKTKDDAIAFKGTDRTAPSFIDIVLEEIDRTGVVPKAIPELTSSQQLQEACHKPNHLCVIAALPHLLEGGAETRNRYLELLSNVAKSFRSSLAFTFLWYEGPSQPDLEHAFGLTFGYPTVVALSLQRGAFSVLQGSFRESVVTSFLHGVTSGRQRTTTLTSSALSVVTVEPWDGQDHEVMEEEEIPLEEIMGEDLDLSSTGDESVGEEDTVNREEL